MAQALRCDGCGTFHESLGNTRYGQGELPIGWFRIYVSDRASEQNDQVTREHHEVCSRACAADIFTRPPTPPETD